MAYTAAQQAKLDAAMAEYNAASAKSNASITDAQTKLSDLNRCVCGKGKVSGACRPLTDTVSFPNLADASNCKTPNPLADCVTDCCSKDTCIAAVNNYNNSISAMDAATSERILAEQKVDAINAELAGDPDVVIASAGAAAGAAANGLALKQKYYFFGIAIIVVGGLIFAYFKWFRK